MCLVESVPGFNPELCDFCQQNGHIPALCINHVMVIFPIRFSNVLGPYPFFFFILYLHYLMRIIVLAFVVVIRTFWLLCSPAYSRLLCHQFHLPMINPEGQSWEPGALNWTCLLLVTLDGTRQGFSFLLQLLLLKRKGQQSWIMNSWLFIVFSSQKFRIFFILYYIFVDFRQMSSLYCVSAISDVVGSYIA